MWIFVLQSELKRTYKFLRMYLLRMRVNVQNNNNKNFNFTGIFVT